MRLRTPTLVVVALAIALGGGAAQAHAAGNASAAAGFVEDAQNADGGFGVKQGRASDPTATLWASVALLAAGRNPRDEFLKNGQSADGYLVAHRSSYRSLEQLGLLAIVQNGGELGAALYGSPSRKLTARLSQQAVRADPEGSALAILGLLQADTPAARRTAESTAQALLGSLTSDGAWGPSGNADSESTALVLQALAATGAIDAGSPAAKSGLAYLAAAQVNDGSIAASTRADRATASGSVAATAFTLQALHALHAPTLRTPTGKTVRQGLTQYQQRSSGGLTSAGSLYSPVPPSVIETAQAFPAFDGLAFPLARVASTTGGPDLAKRTHTKGSAPSAKRVSGGSAAQGLAGGGHTSRDAGAFRRGRVGGRRSSKGTTGPAKPGSGSDVTGTVVGKGPPLATKAGASDSGLTNQQRATIVLGSALAAAFLLGAFLERLRPRPPGTPPAPVALGLRLGPPLKRAGGWVSGLQRAGTGRRPHRPWALALVLAVGAVLIAVPFATHMFHRAPEGARMVDAFAPHMQRIDAYQRDVADVDAYAREAAALGSPQQLARRYPQYALFAQQWPAVHRRLTTLLGTVESNRKNYDAVAALPSFRLFPWFFVAPGALLVLLALAGLLAGGHAWIPLRRATIALGVGLLLAPLVFQMYSRAPQGARMVATFDTIETRANVQQIQGDFGTIAVGQGAIRTDLRRRLRELPAAARLQQRWTRILGDLTPLLGVMSDNVVNYRAVAALPSFRVFPWLFALPGLLVIGLAVLAGVRTPPDPTPKRKEPQHVTKTNRFDRPRARVRG